ncbi:MAG: PhoU domain-containing protein [Sulfuricurvum sp.]|nr:PhoU domain-containing protein [Sulfuricurvum sp.]
MNGIRTQLSALVGEIISASQETLNAFETNNDEGYEKSKNHLKNAQNDANAIDNEIIKTFALFGPEAEELRMLVAFLKMTNELDRIGDAVKKYNRRLQEHCNGGCDLSALTSTIVQLHKTTLNALQYIFACLNAIDECDTDELYRKVMVEESKNDDIFSIMEKELLNVIIDSGELSIEYVKVLGTLRKLERTGDRTVNIAALLVYAQKGGEIHLF